MAWRVRSMSEGPVCLSDIGINFRKGDIMDLDLLGREHAESSNDIKLALQKGWIREIEKTPHTSSASTATFVQPIDPALVEKLEAAATKADAAAQAMEVQKAETAVQQAAQQAAMEKLTESNAKLEAKLEAQALARHEGDNIDVLGEVKKYLEQDPLGIKVLKEALENIQIERGQIVGDKEDLHSSGDSEAELMAKERILRLRDEKLEKNAEKIGKSISSSADDIDDLLGDMDALGI